MGKLLDLKEFLIAKKYYLVGIIIFLLLLGFSIYFSIYKYNDDKNEEFIILEENKKEIETVEEIIEECYLNVDIKGEVKVPGLYEVVCDSRVQDVINMAGGITQNGDTTVLNLGKKLEDEMVIIVYSKEQVRNFNSTKLDESIRIESCTNENEIINDVCINESDLIDSYLDNDSGDEEIGDTPVKVLISINTATKEELMTLSGIGESKANNIINYRNENGNFKSIEELKNVKGIGDSIFEKIKDSITL